MELRKTYRWEASHILPLHSGQCHRLHGHSWVLHVFVEGKVDPKTGFVKDFADISLAAKPLVESLDHRHLGQWASHLDENGLITLTPGTIYQWGVVASPSLPRMGPPEWDKFFYPSSENLLYWFGRELKKVGLDWSKLAIEETCTSYAVLQRHEFEGYGDQENV